MQEYTVRCWSVLHLRPRKMLQSNHVRALLKAPRPFLFLSAVALLACTISSCWGNCQASSSMAHYSCRVTIPNGSPPPGKSAICSTRVGCHYEYFGNGKLWTVLPSNGKLLITPQQGSLWSKFPWWRALQGTLTVEGRRLDASAEPLQVSIPEGYGKTGFQPTGVLFSSEGCWKVTGSVGESKLTFVIEVVQEAR